MKPRFAPLAGLLAAGLAAGLLALPSGAQAPGPGATQEQPPPSSSAPAPARPATPSARGERVDGVVAVVNDEVVLASEVDEQVYLFLQQARVRPDSSGIAQLRKEVLDRIIDEKVIVSEAKRQNVTLAEAELKKNVDDAIADVKARLGSEAAFRAELEREGITEEDLRKRYREDASRQMMANQLLRRQLGGKVDVTPAEAEKYFTENPSQFPKRASAIHVQLVQIPVELDSAAKRGVRQKAVAAQARLKKGEPFSRLAQELSEDAGTASNGGDLGWFGREQLDSTFTAQVFKIPVGQVSGILETPFGYHLVKVEEADPTKGEIRARHILFRLAPTEDDARRVKQRIDEVRTQAVKGVDFGTLARRYSRFDGPSGPDGDLGFLPMTAFSPEFRAALDTLETGQVSPPLLNAQGWHLFKVLDRESERAYRIDELAKEVGPDGKPVLPELVRQAKLKNEYETYVADLRKKATIEYR
jgi:peptidyl-prolyl cis-trans isomerase SurA